MSVCTGVFRVGWLLVRWTLYCFWSLHAFRISIDVLRLTIANAIKTNLFNVKFDAKRFDIVDFEFDANVWQND